MNYNEIESFITNLKSVLSCKIIYNDNNDIEEIHILSDSSRSTKQVSRDVQSVLVSKFNLNVDYKKISIAQIDKNLSDSTVDETFRLLHKGISYSSAKGHIQIKVHLKWNDMDIDGEAEGIKTSSNILKLTARATLNAIENAIGAKDCLVLEDLKIIRLIDKDTVIQAITFITKDEEQHLCGSAFINGDKMEAVVKAALDAINRRVIIYNGVY